MQVKIIFPYSEMVVPPRCRKPRLQHFNDGQFTIDIPEVSGADAPVAIRSSGVFLSRSNVRFAVDYRWWQGCLWTSLRVDSVEPRGMTSGHDDWDYASWPAVLDLTSPANAGRSYEFGIYGPRDESKLAWEEYLSTVAGSHLIIDGVPHRVAGEPRYVVMTFGLGRNHGGTACMVDAYYNGNINRDRYFSLLERERAIAAATEIATTRGDTESVPIKPHGPQWEILIPEAVQVNPAAQHGEGCSFLNALEQVAQGTGGSPVAGIAAMAALVHSQA